MIGACVGLAAVKFDLPTDAETLDALFAIPADGANPDLSGERAPGAAGALLNKTWGAVTGGVTTLGTAAVTGVGALGVHYRGWGERVGRAGGRHRHRGSRAW